MSLFTDIGRWEGYKERIYLDHAGIPTIGVGYNLRNEQVLGLVLNKFGYNDTNLGLDDFDSLVSELGDIFERDWTNDNLDTRVQEIETTLTSYRDNIAENEREAVQENFEFSDSNGNGSTHDEMEPIFDTAILDFEEAIVDRLENRLDGVDQTGAQALWDGLSETKQNALLSLSFNGGAGIIGSNLAGAINTSNWADAYYEIAFGSNRATLDVDGDGDGNNESRPFGLQRRRFAESDEFIEDLTTAEKQALYDKLVQEQSTIEDYLDAVANVDDDRNATEIEAGSDRLTELFDHVNDLMDELVADLSAEGITVADIDFESSKVSDTAPEPTPTPEPTPQPGAYSATAGTHSATFCTVKKRTSLQSSSFAQYARFKVS